MRDAALVWHLDRLVSYHRMEILSYQMLSIIDRQYSVWIMFVCYRMPEDLPANPYVWKPWRRLLSHRLPGNTKEMTSGWSHSPDRVFRPWMFIPAPNRLSCVLICGWPRVRFRDERVIDSIVTFGRMTYKPSETHHHLEIYNLYHPQ